MTSFLYYCCPYLPFIIDLVVLIPFWRLVSIVDTNDYMVIYMIAVNIPYTVRLVPQYMNILAPPKSPIHVQKINFLTTTPPAPIPLGSAPNQMFFSMMSAFMVITMCYGAFNVLICILQEIRRGKMAKWNIWLPVCMMMAITQGVLIAIYKFHFLSESIIPFLVAYYVAICGIMAIVVAIFLRRPRPNDATWQKRRQTINAKFNRFILFGAIAVVPSLLYTLKVVAWYLRTVEITSTVYPFTDYMIHPWVFNMAGILLLDPFRKVTSGSMRPFSSIYRKYRSSPQTISAVYRIPPPSYSDATYKTKPSRPTQMY